MKNKSKILISILGFSAGGAEILPIRLANSLHDRGYTVGVHCTKPSADKSVRSRLHLAHGVGAAARISGGELPLYSVPATVGQGKATGSISPLPSHCHFSWGI